MNKIDLSALVKDIHLIGHDCLPVRMLRQLQASNHPTEPRIEFWTTSQENPRKITCVHCWRDFWDEYKKAEEIYVRMNNRLGYKVVVT